MPQPDSGGGGAAEGVRERLKVLLEKWEATVDEIEDFQNGEQSPGGGYGAQLNTLKAQRERLMKRINQILKNHHNLVGVADDYGYEYTAVTGQGQGGQGGNQPGGQGGGGSGAGGSGGKAGAGGGSGGGPDDDLLPGSKGQNYQLVKHNGKFFAVYTVKVGGKVVKTAWRIKDPSKHGFGEGDFRPVSNSMFKSIQVFGTSDEITRRGGNKHPFKKWLDEMTAIYGGTSILKNKETLGVLIEAFLEKQDPAITEGKLRQTKWYQNRTSYQRQWEMVFTKKERDKKLGNMVETIKDRLDDIYGTVNWRKYINDGQINKWAEKIASGAWDEPGAALESWANRIIKGAEKVEGSNAYINAQQEAIAANEFMNRPEEMFEQIRQQAIEWLGYKGKFDQSTLKKWAEDLAFERKSEADWMQYLRETKKALYPYLDPDETWTDAASAYKSIAEDILGTTLSWKDKLLGNMAGVDANGKPTGGRMSHFDFEKLARGDDRFWGGKVAAEEGYGLLSKLNETFNGVAA